MRLALPLALVFFVLARPTPVTLGLGSLMALVGLFIRARTAGYLRKNTELAIGGPYAWTRNPLYLGSLLMACGFMVAGRSLLAGVLGVTYFGAFYATAIVREEAKLRARFGAAFEAYAARVPRLWPRWHAAAGGLDTRFSWALYRRNHEYWAAIGFAVGVALLWLKMQHGVLADHRWLSTLLS